VKVRNTIIGVSAFALALAGCGNNSTTVPGFPVASPSAPLGASPSPNPHPSASTTPTAAASATASASASATPSASATAMPSASAAPTSSAYIKHIVIIIQENRAFDTLFHGFSEPSGRQADYANVGYDKAGNAIPLQQIELEGYYSPSHGHGDFYADYDNGKNDGFKDNNNGTAANTGNYGYAYLDQTEIQPYWDMAHNGALAERFFHGVTASTWSSHLMFVAGSTTYDGNPNHRVVGNPQINLGWGCEDGNPSDHTATIDPATNVISPGPFPCFTGVTTIADLLQNAGRSWHYYSGLVSKTVIDSSGDTLTTPGGNLNALATYTQIFNGPTWSANAIMPETRILADVPAGTLADVTYVVPEGPNSDIAQGGTATGPQWVASVVNTIGQSQFWKNTAIFVTWDDWGGWYDHVPPPQKYGYFGLGFRIPLIAISPYAKAGQLIDTQLEPGSVLKFVEETFDLPSLGTTDATSNSASVMFDFTQPPANFATVSSKLRAKDFLARPPDTRPVDPD
jgi:phospholipase C